MKGRTYSILGIACGLAWVWGAALWHAEAVADKRQLIRFYRIINEQGQERKVGGIRKADEAGCHNTLTARDVNRIAVVGFAWCAVYTDQSCREDTLLKPLWAKKKHREFVDRSADGRMGPGTRWVLDKTQNVEVRSFRCEPESG